MACQFLTNLDGLCWCGTKLTGRQRKFCSRQCARAVTNNHRWTQAKAQAKKAMTFYMCEDCRGYFGPAEIEVNHIEPCKGKHGVWGCHHHQKNLEVLCRKCHLVKTNIQRENGWT